MTMRMQIAAAGLAWCGLAGPVALGQGTPPPSILPRTESVASISGSNTTVNGRLTLDPVRVAVGPKAIVRSIGTAAPGLKVRLDGSSSSGGQVWYRWVQASGPKVSILGADQPMAQFIVPIEATELGFVLVVGNAAGIDARPLTVAVESAEFEAEPLPLKADAGSDLVATSGQKVVLDGARSEPRGQIKFRWVQTSGPKTVDLTSYGTTCSFVPDQTGVYQFALLVVGVNDLVSEADSVSVQVKYAKPRSSEPATERPPLALDELARTALASIPGGPGYAADISRSFDGVADRIDSYKTFLEVATELTRRLDEIIPRDPSRRSLWVNRFLKPWNSRLVEISRENGLDLEQAGGQSKPLTKAQRARLAEQFRVTAAGLRAGLTLR